MELISISRKNYVSVEIKAETDKNGRLCFTKETLGSMGIGLNACLFLS